MTQTSEPPADDRPAEQQGRGESGLPPPGWYADPYGAPSMRWWDGTQWTSTTSQVRRGVHRPDRRRSTAIERIVYGLAITAAALPILPAFSPPCSGELNVDACQRGDAKANIWLGSISTGLAVAGLVIAIYALTRPNAHRRAMTAMSAVFVIGFFLLIGLTGQMTQATYGSLPSLKGYDTGPLLIMTGAGLLAGFVLIGVHYRSRYPGPRRQS
ncbi:MAG TPA: DUF2510 domain-containing protein [Acidimicrobiales bacterium]|nr:DUF2510 domain-containing protein [Acidimicrobiales bacterium]